MGGLAGSRQRGRRTCCSQKSRTNFKTQRGREEVVKLFVVRVEDPECSDVLMFWFPPAAGSPAVCIYIELNLFPQRFLVTDGRFNEELKV